MPKAVDELKKYENSDEIRDKIFQTLRKNLGKAYLLDEIEHLLIREYDLGINIGGKFFIYNTLRDMINLNRIQSIISKGIEYFFIEK
jgi:hypothetical protein